MGIRRPILTGWIIFATIALVAIGPACNKSSGRRSKTILPLAITTTTLPDGERGLAYSATIQGTGGLAPYTWTISAGALPPPLTLDASSGVISGTPSATGIHDITVDLTDGQFVPVTVSASYRILVYGPSGSNTPPTVGLAGVLGTQRNLVDLSYKLIDADSDPATITVDFSSDSGTTWSPATEGPGGDGTAVVRPVRTFLHLSMGFHGGPRHRPARHGADTDHAFRSGGGHRR
ncbi:MAG: Ig domain-containing protein [Planctomycetota bacterium]|nr:Ig domain-containing protein [Planctomycetota bacterium]